MIKSYPGKREKDIIKPKLNTFDPFRGQASNDSGQGQKCKDGTNCDKLNIVVFLEIQLSWNVEGIGGSHH